MTAIQMGKNLFSVFCDGTVGGNQCQHHMLVRVNDFDDIPTVLRGYGWIPGSVNQIHKCPECRYKPGPRLLTIPRMR